MLEQKDFERAKACFPPEATEVAHQIYEFLIKNYPSASIFMGGMSVNFQGLNKNYLEKVARKYYSIDLTRYGYQVDYLEKQLREQYDTTETDSS